LEQKIPESRAHFAFLEGKMAKKKDRSTTAVFNTPQYTGLAYKPDQPVDSFGCRRMLTAQHRPDTSRRCVQGFDLPQISNQLRSEAEVTSEQVRPKLLFSTDSQQAHTHNHLQHPGTQSHGQAGNIGDQHGNYRHQADENPENTT
jgi:hypothetical protein